MNVKGQTTLAINLRSMLINGNKALLQAGAGITLESIPENEWLETEEKMKTIKNLLG
ncbi:MAG: chorismate-binding protein [Bacteroidetes bacterium]|nr:chorismate-binding protein [Bacteroidota bacterium]